jgi:hypothetical protein
MLAIDSQAFRPYPKSAIAQAQFHGTRTELDPDMRPLAGLLELQPTPPVGGDATR